MAQVVLFGKALESSTMVSVGHLNL